MKYIIYKDDIEENRIVADEAFCQEHYSTGGYTYQMEPKSELEMEPEPTQLDRVEAQVAYTAMMTDTLLEV